LFIDMIGRAYLDFYDELVCMLDSTAGVGIIDSNWFWNVWILASRIDFASGIDSNSKLEFVALASRINF